MPWFRNPDLSAIEAAVKDIETKVTNLDQDVVSLDGVVDDIKTTVGKIDTSVGTNLGANVTAIKTSVGTGLRAAVTTVDTVVDAIALSVGTRLGANVTAIKGSVGTGLSSAVAGIATKVTSIQTSVGTGLRAAVQTIGANVGAVQTSVGTGLGAAVTAIGTNVTAIKTSVGAGLRTIVGAVGTNVGKVLTSVGTGLGTNVAAIKAAIDQMHPTVSGLTDIVVAKWIQDDGAAPYYWLDNSADARKAVRSIFARVDAGLEEVTVHATLTVPTGYSQTTWTRTSASFQVDGSDVPISSKVLAICTKDTGSGCQLQIADQQRANYGSPVSVNPALAPEAAFVPMPGAVGTGDTYYLWFKRTASGPGHINIPVIWIYSDTASEDKDSPCLESLSPPPSGPPSRKPSPTPRSFVRRWLKL